MLIQLESPQIEWKLMKIGEFLTGVWKLSYRSVYHNNQKTLVLQKLTEQSPG